ncbi:MAG: J domain-containing protein [Candidatus Woesearchaeota archaeon]
MATITIKGHEISDLPTQDSFGRRALQYKNKIIYALSKAGFVADDVIIDLEPIAIRNVPASVTWYGEGYRMYYDYKSADRYVDNLSIISQVIEFEVDDLLSGKKTFGDFLGEFTEEEDVEDMRKEARETLGVEHDVLDMAEIDKKYKKLAKQHHPDMPGGNNEIFKSINNAHKILRRELC